MSKLNSLRSPPTSPTKQTVCVETTTRSVNHLLETFNVRHEEPGHTRRRYSIAEPRRWPKERIPEVAALVDDVFTRVGHLRRPLSIDSRCGSEKEFVDDNRSVLTDTTDAESSISGAEAVFIAGGQGGKIGAMWTQEYLPCQESFTRQSEVRQLCTKKLSHYLERLNLHRSWEGRKSKDNQEWTESLQSVLSEIDEMEDTEMVPQILDVSVKTCRALIEMTVHKGECFKPTLNGINRPPTHPLSEDGKVVFASKQEL